MAYGTHDHHCLSEIHICYSALHHALAVSARSRRRAEANYRTTPVRAVRPQGTPLAAARLLRGKRYIHDEDAVVPADGPETSSADGDARQLAGAQVVASAPDCPMGPSPAGQDDDVAERVDRAVQRLAHAGHLSDQHVLATPAGLSALGLLDKAGPLRVGDLAARTGVAFPTMSRIVERIVKDGWAQRQADETDHRACVVSVTAEGKTLVDTAQHGRSGVLAAALDQMSPEDRVTLLAAVPPLEWLAAHVSETPAREAGQNGQRPQQPLLGDSQGNGGGPALIGGFSASDRPGSP